MIGVPMPSSDLDKSRRSSFVNVLVGCPKPADRVVHRRWGAGRVSALLVDGKYVGAVVRFDDGAPRFNAERMPIEQRANIMRPVSAVLGPQARAAADIDNDSKE